ncbi:hypothetical protein Goshw_011067 [Gossypium schwendimanii]|uniref:LOB domain-containing protein n=1 Tax=Gossypium schwendimanii TaxID=34291 RepID=A0A7J9MHA4_GOSSC|nr:hypothetical protein [Gossypium schwendimanii]
MTGLGCSCGACKFLRRKCTNECVFAPYFCYDEAANHFAAVHKVFGASNASKLLLHLPIHNRSDAAITIAYEALARIRDPIYGCVAHIFALQQQVAGLQEEIETLINQMANHAVEVPIEAVQFGSIDETMNTLYHQDEQATLLNLQGSITGNQVVHGQLCEEDSAQHSFKWVEDSKFLSNIHENPYEISFEGLEFGDLIDYPCMVNTGIPSNWEIPIL